MHGPDDPALRPAILKKGGSDAIVRRRDSTVSKWALFIASGTGNRRDGLSC
jgi:hypothetical protein